MSGFRTAKTASVSRKRARSSNSDYELNDNENVVARNCSSPKRPRLRNKLHSAGFYDSLSKIQLTRRALREFDRRDGRVGRRSRESLQALSVFDTPTYGQLLKRFARHGGADLHDLRGVSLFLCRKIRKVLLRR